MRKLFHQLDLLFSEELKVDVEDESLQSDEKEFTLQGENGVDLVVVLTVFWHSGVLQDNIGRVLDDHLCN